METSTNEVISEVKKLRQYVSSKKLKIESILVTSDIFRIDDRSSNQFENPQRVNVDWIYKLIAPVVCSAIGVSRIEKLYGDEGGFNSLRWKIFSMLELPIEGASWASVYDAVEPEVLSSVLDGKFDKKLVLGFELSPSLIQYFEDNEIPYIDLTIHPVRFLPDYMFGIRTNVSEWENKIKSQSLPESLMYDFARVSSARTARIMRGKLPVEESALFLGQLTVDASLISNGSMMDDEYLAESLMRLSSAYPKVYFKSHPHCKNQNERKKLVSKIKNCEWIDVNIYDALACEQFSLVTAISSGGVIEAKYFGCNASWMSDKKNVFDLSKESEMSVYWPIYNDSMKSEFWGCVLNDSSLVHIARDLPNPFEGALKFNINMKWGR